MNVPSLRVSSKRPNFIPLRTCSPLSLGSMGGRCFCCCQVLRSVEAAPSGAGFVAPAGRGRRKGAIAAAPPVDRAMRARAPAWIGELRVPCAGGLPFLFFSGLRRALLGSWFGRSERCRASVELGFTARGACPRLRGLRPFVLAS